MSWNCVAPGHASVSGWILYLWHFILVMFVFFKNHFIIEDVLARDHLIDSIKPFGFVVPENVLSS